MVEGDRPKTVGIEKIRARSRILVDRDDQRAAIARQVRALDIPLGLEHGHAFAGRQIAPDEESELAAVVGGVVELRPFVGKGLRLAGDGLDRKSGVEGKSVSVRLDRGGRRSSKKKKYIGYK